MTYSQTLPVSEGKASSSPLTARLGNTKKSATASTTPSITETVDIMLIRFMRHFSASHFSNLPASSSSP